VLQHSRTEENFREIPKKLNADKVKRALLNNHNGGVGDVMQVGFFFKREKINI
jgi:hypothetical protein